MNFRDNSSDDQTYVIKKKKFAIDSDSEEQVKPIKKQQDESESKIKKQVKLDTPIKQEIKSHNSSQKIHQNSIDNKKKAEKNIIKKEENLEQKLIKGSSDVSQSKQKLIYNILIRWWYCMPEWPPINYNYKQILTNKKLRQVDFTYWKLEQEIDQQGFKKVYMLPGFDGIFKDSQGQVYDLRPHDVCPSYNSLKTKNFRELANLQEKALRNQIKELEQQPNFDNQLIQQLRKEHNLAEKLRIAYNQKIE